MKQDEDRFPKNPEKRNYQRIDLELPVVIEVDGKTVSATTENVSCGGMFLPNLSQFAEQQDITTIVNLPDRAEAIRLTGKVVRIEEESGRCGIAVGFDGLYDDNRLAIDRYIKWKLLN